MSFLSDFCIIDSAKGKEKGRAFSVRPSGAGKGGGGGWGSGSEGEKEKAFIREENRGGA